MPFKRIKKELTPEQKAKYAAMRSKVKEEFPPTKEPRWKPTANGIGLQIRQAREAAGLTWYALAKRAGIPNSSTIRDIEAGRDVRISNLEAIAGALGLHVALVKKAA
jgi:ribosome-binding protein aMBF1 (putative translation factor)